RIRRRGVDRKDISACILYIHIEIVLGGSPRSLDQYLLGGGHAVGADCKREVAAGVGSDTNRRSVHRAGRVRNERPIRVDNGRIGWAKSSARRRRWRRNSSWCSRRSH